MSASIDSAPAQPPAQAPAQARATDWAAVRALYPAADSCAYLNTASRGLLCDAARNAGENYYRVLYEDAGAGLSNHWLPHLEEARVTVAAFIGAEPESIAFVPNASAAMNLGADLIAEPGEALAHRDEFPSVTLPFEQRGHTLRLLAPDASGTVGVDDYAAAIGPETRYLLVSAVQYASGYRVDLPALRALCDRHGLYLLVDATQAVASVPIDISTFRPDVLTFSSYKWACAGYGVAAMYVSPELRATRRLPSVGWRSATNAYGLANHDAELRHDALALEMGNPVMPAPLVLGASLTVIREIGVDAIASRVATLTRRLRDGARTLGIPVRSPTLPAHASAITMLELTDAADHEKRLRECGVQTSARAGSLRVSPHLYSNEDDIDALLDALTVR